MKLVFVLLLVCSVVGQQAGTLQAETHPALTTYTCTSKNNCQTTQRSIVLDSNWRWLHKVNDSTNCYTGNTWDTTICPNPATCTTNCALEGVDYSTTYGIATSGNKVSLRFVTVHAYGTNIGSRIYLMSSDSAYQMFQLKNREFSFDVDVSQLPCGLNGALYFVEMASNGGLGTGNNKAGAKFGTGYCDAQCPHDMKFINGEANILDWKPSPNDTNAGTGRYGTCCGEMDVWEANSVSTAYTAHDCTTTGLYRCSGTQCGDIEANQRYQGVCDKDGCDFNSYRLGQKSFYGKGMTIDTSKVITVITQYVTVGNTDGGDLSEIRRLWKQNNVVVANSVVSVSGTNYDSLRDTFCTAEKTLFGDVQDFSAKGGMRQHGAMIGRGVVLVMSLWDDHYAHMLWLDSNYPTTASASTPGVARGSCATSSGNPTDVEKNNGGATVSFSNIRFGPIGSTY